MLVSDSPMLLLANSRSRRTLCGALALSLALLAQGCSVSNTALTNAAALSGGVGLYFGRASSDNSGVFYVAVSNFRVWQLP